MGKTRRTPSAPITAQVLREFDRLVIAPSMMRFRKSERYQSSRAVRSRQAAEQRGYAHWQQPETPVRHALQEAGGGARQPRRFPSLPRSEVWPCGTGKQVQTVRPCVSKITRPSIPPPPHREASGSAWLDYARTEILRLAKSPSAVRSLPLLWPKPKCLTTTQPEVTLARIGRFTMLPGANNSPMSEVRNLARVLSD